MMLFLIIISSALAYTSQSYPEALAMRPYVPYITCATYCWNLIPDSLDQVESQIDSNTIYYFEFQTWNLALQPA